MMMNLQPISYFSSNIQITSTTHIEILSTSLTFNTYENEEAQKGLRGCLVQGVGHREMEIERFPLFGSIREKEIEK